MARGTFGSTVRVEGLGKLSRLVREANDEIDHWLREGLLGIGEKVAVDVRRSYAEYSVVGADAIKSKIAKSGAVFVAQTLRRGRDMNRRRANFGGLMMRKAFLPALDRNQAAAEASAEALLLDLERKWDL